MKKELTLSFAGGRGDLDHNARRKNSNPRTYGLRNRQVWNETLVEKDVKEVLAAEFSGPIMKYNEKQIANRHPERCKTLEDWVAAQCRKKRVYREYVLQLGNRLTGCAYEYVTDAEGRMIAEDGSVIQPWQTRKTPKALWRNGKLYASKEQKVLKQIYRDMLKRFKELNPNMIVVGAFVHCDEKGGVHMHVDAICKCRTKNGIGCGTGVTSCIAQELDAMGISYGTTRYNNAQKTWTALMRKALTEVAKEHGISIVDGHCAGRKHKNTERFIEEENIRNEVLDKQYEALLKKEQSLKQKEDALAKKETILTERETILTEKESKLKLRESVVETNKKTVEQIRSMNQSENKRLQAEEKRLKQKEAALAQKERALAAREQALVQKQYIIDKVQKEHPEYLVEVVHEFKSRDRQKNKEL